MKKSRVLLPLAFLLSVALFWVLKKYPDSPRASPPAIQEGQLGSHPKLIASFARGITRDLTFAQGEGNFTLILSFADKNGVKHSLSVPTPSSQDMAHYGYELAALDLGPGTPPSLRFSLSGGGDGLRTTFDYVFSLVKDQVFLTFNYRSESDSYFNVGNCTYLDNGFFWEEPGSESGQAPAAFTKVALTRSRLSWDEAQHRFQKSETQTQESWIAPVTAVTLYSQPNTRSRAQELPPNTRLRVLGYRRCDPKDGSPDCDPGLPADMPRWYQVAPPDGSTAWYLVTEESQYDTNLRCSL